MYLSTRLRMRFPGVGLSVCLFGCLLLIGCRKQAANEPAAVARLTVFAPCGMELPFMNIEEKFEVLHPGLDITTVLDSADVLARRIADKGEYADIFVSPGGVETERLEQSGLLAPEDISTFGQYELMLFVPRDNTANVTAMADLVSERVRTVAVSDPEVTSVGRYTRQALQAAGLWDRIQDKIVITASPSIAYKHVARQKADASFAYRSCPLKTAPEKLEYSKVRVIEPVPPGTYGPAFATVGILRKAANPELAHEYVAFLLSDAGQGIFRSYDLPSLRKCSP